jgi:5'-nucleotidase
MFSTTRRSALVATSAVVMAALAGCTAETVPAPSAATATSTDIVRSILLTDDDGWDADGITLMYDELVAAGYDVTLVGPKVNFSGASQYAVGGDLAAQQPTNDPNKWWVDGTPVDSVRVGLLGILETPPDLVISGINHGANVAYNVNYSGTVGAATAAAEQGIPAIAVSADVGADDAATNFAAGAELTIALVKSLSEDALAEMADGDVININVPYSTADNTDPRGVRVATQAEVEWQTKDYTLGDDGEWVISYSEAPSAESDSDKVLIAAGYSTLTVLSAARDGDNQHHPALDAALSELAPGD